MLCCRCRGWGGAGVTVAVVDAPNWWSGEDASDSYFQRDLRAPLAGGGLWTFVMRKLVIGGGYNLDFGSGVGGASDIAVSRSERLCARCRRRRVVSLARRADPLVATSRGSTRRAASCSQA